MSEKKRKVILTGDRPTGRLHIGHYVGSLRERVVLQNSGAFDDVLIMIADAQALTDNWDNPEKVRSNIMNVTLDYLSAGIDPEKSHILIQSQIPELPELTQYYMNLVTVQRLQRNPTVKAEIKLRGFSEHEESQGTPVGFFCRQRTSQPSAQRLSRQGKTRSRWSSRREKLSESSTPSMERHWWSRRSFFRRALHLAGSRGQTARRR